MFILLAPVGPSLFFKVPIFNSIWVRIFKLLVPVIIRIMRRMISILFSKILEICSERYEITNDHNMDDFMGNRVIIIVNLSKQSTTASRWHLIGTPGEE